MSQASAGPDAGGPGDEPGSGLRALVEVMDRLRSPDGCPWDAEQTHRSLVPYVLEEAHEVAEAIEQRDRAGMREELGDLLLQVVFHARIAEEDPDDPFDVDDVARGITAKLVRRHPHVFADASGAGSLEDLHVQWDRIKAEEKRRASVLDGIPATLGAVARAQKVVGRARRSGHGDLVSADARARAESLGERLLDLVAEAQAAGVDAEQELRAATRELESRVRGAEARRPQT
ncbi:MazG family protein [Cellulomonas chengniuliangii]|uniref:MazG family protein n=1 Tax=Cellulomonas chengniuliangii TaxID=2968084 RepID=UPI001D0E242B|nr:MazG family protein [Cellulomonas chengniuliangii]MCC2316495.1 MazG family protein [Cellulomonas chengniuliangii]